MARGSRKPRNCHCLPIREPYYESMQVALPPQLELRTTPAELRLDLAVGMYSSRRLTLAQAARLSEIDRLSFQRELAARHIPIHYSMKDLGEDVQAVREMTGHDRGQ